MHSSSKKKEGEKKEKGHNKSCHCVAHPSDKIWCRVEEKGIKPQAYVDQCINDKVYQYANRLYPWLYYKWALGMFM